MLQKLRQLCNTDSTLACGQTKDMICKMFYPELVPKCCQCLEYKCGTDTECENCYCEDPTLMIENLKEYVDEYNLVGVELGSGDEIGHSFVIFKDGEKDNVKYYKIDSYLCDHGIEIVEFDFSTLHDFLTEPAIDKYNKMFNCEEFGGGDEWTIVICIPK